MKPTPHLPDETTSPTGAHRGPAHGTTDPLHEAVQLRAFLHPKIADELQKAGFDKTARLLEILTPEVLHEFFKKGGDTPCASNQCPSTTNISIPLADNDASNAEPKSDPSVSATTPAPDPQTEHCHECNGLGEHMFGCTFYSTRTDEDRKADFEAYKARKAAPDPQATASKVSPEAARKFTAIWAEIAARSNPHNLPITYCECIAKDVVPVGIATDALTASQRGRAVAGGSGEADA